MTNAQATARLSTWRMVLALLAIVSAILSFAFYFIPVEKLLKAALLVLWLTVPPIWFWFEYHIFNRYLTDEDKKSLKEYQDVSSKLWAGVAAALALLYFGQSHGE